MMIQTYNYGGWIQFNDLHRWLPSFLSQAKSFHGIDRFLVQFKPL